MILIVQVSGHTRFSPPRPFWGEVGRRPGEGGTPPMAARLNLDTGIDIDQ